MERSKLSRSNDSGFLNRNTYEKEERKDDFAFNYNDNVSVSVRTP